VALQGEVKLKSLYRPLIRLLGQGSNMGRSAPSIDPLTSYFISAPLARYAHPMPPFDLDINRAAHLLIQQHGDSATAEGTREGRRTAKGADSHDDPQPSVRAFIALAAHLFDPLACLTTGLSAPRAAMSTGMGTRKKRR
jgi:hypothetical protein